MDCRRPFVVLALSLSLLCGAPATLAQDASLTHAHSQPFIIEYYYKAKWGHASEFVSLFRKNYYPILVKMREQGRILSIVTHAPRHHATEEGRWDYRVTVVWRDVVTAHENHHPEEIIAKLFPDLETYKREEQRRFEILIAHWDVLVEEKDRDPAPVPQGSFSPTKP
jgi:hypothetical protein